MVFAQIGPLTTLFEGVATAVGAGIVAVGLVGIIVTFGVYIFLDERARRRKERGQ